MPENREWLAELFEARLLSLGPESVLDVGCGTGELVAALAARGVPARGIEPDPKKADAAREARRAVELGSAECLDLADGSQGWVTLRHVPHHLSDPRAALAEAWRVARAGVLVAEPWFDDGVPSQRLARELDRFLKRLDRARGEHHADVLASGEVLALLPAEGERRIECHVRLGTLRPEVLEQDLEEARGGRELGSEEQDLVAAFRRATRAGRVSLPGTVIVTAWKPT